MSIEITVWEVKSVWVYVSVWEPQDGFYSYWLRLYHCRALQTILFHFPTVVR